MWRLSSLALLGALSLPSQQSPGRVPAPDEIRAYGFTIAPDGKGLPPGQGTAAEGRELFAAKCSRCHGEKAQGSIGPALVGGIGTLASSKPSKTVGSFWPYAPAVWDYIHRAMPFDKAGSLSPNEVYALVAALLHWNGIIGEPEVMNAASLSKVRMPNRNGFVPDPRPDTKRK